MSATFLTPPRIITGVGSLGECGAVAAALGRCVLLVTGKSSMRRSGASGRLITDLQAAGLACHLYDAVATEPTLDMVDEGRRLCRERGCDLVIGMGGGSAMDAAKVIAGLAREEAPARDFHQGKKVERTGLPFIAIPTTSGTGAEVTKNGVISDPENRVKKSIRDDSFMAKAAIVDPELTVSAPPHVTACAGMDALTQAIESFTSIHATPLTDALAFKAIGLMAGCLERAVKNGSDIEARSDASYGSLLAGMALANARLGVVHGMAHPLGVRYGIPHGLVCGVLLPAAMRLNREASADKYDRIDALLGGDAVEFVERLAERIGLARSLADYDIPREDFDAIVAESMPSGSLKANPKKITEEDVRSILEQVC